ncbi:transcriptional regulator [Stenotrophomonas maltophilia]|uniref:transcriptional regulator n=1 Tax=Stenotrophomonas maltophilia TaxID=40324 RepID=UPI003CE58673
MAKTPIQRAVEVAGSQSVLAKLAGASPQFVHQWVTGRRPVPARYVLGIEAATGVTRYELRPDVFGPFSSAEEAA